MFTVKLIMGGIEGLYPNIAHVEYHGPFGKREPGVTLHSAGGNSQEIMGKVSGDNMASSDEARIYVMNDNGKTVATYKLHSASICPASVRID